MRILELRFLKTTGQFQNRFRSKSKFWTRRFMVGTASFDPTQAKSESPIRRRVLRTTLEPGYMKQSGLRPDGGCEALSSFKSGKKGDMSGGFFLRKSKRKEEKGRKGKETVVKGHKHRALRLCAGVGGRSPLLRKWKQVKRTEQKLKRSEKSENKWKVLKRIENRWKEVKRRNK